MTCRLYIQACSLLFSTFLIPSTERSASRLGEVAAQSTKFASEFDCHGSHSELSDSRRSDTVASSLPASRTLAWIADERAVP